jgi:hypothetical protein
VRTAGGGGYVAYGFAGRPAVMDCQAVFSPVGLPGGSGDVGRDDVCGVAVQRHPGPVVSHVVRASAWDAAS